MISDFNIQGMHCISCKQLIEEEIREVAGVENITVDLPTGHAQVVYDEQQISAQFVAAKITALGYPSQLAHQ